MLRYRERMSNYRQILNGVHAYDAQSQLMFYDLFIHSVFRSALAITGHEGEAEEIAQDTMLKVFDNRSLLNEDAKAMERILRRIAANAAIDVIRRRKNSWVHYDEAPVVDERLDDTDEDENDFSIEEIKEGIGALSDTYRSILTLRLFEDMSFADVADQLKIKCSTARVQYTRGIAKLKDLLIKKRGYVR